MRRLYCDLDGVLFDFVGGFLSWMIGRGCDANLRHQDATCYDLSCLAPLLGASVTETDVEAGVQQFLRDADALIQLDLIAPVYRAITYFARCFPDRLTFSTARTGVAFEAAGAALDAHGLGHLPLESKQDKQLYVTEGHVVLDDHPPIPELLRWPAFYGGDLVLVRQPWNRRRSGTTAPPWIHYVCPCDAEDIGMMLVRLMDRRMASLS